MDVPLIIDEKLPRLLGFLSRFTGALCRQRGARHIAWTSDLLYEEDKRGIWLGPSVRPTEEWVAEQLPPGLSNLRCQMHGDILIHVWRDRDRIVFDIVDFAPPVDPRRVKPRALDDVRPGGLGTHFINECMDECEFRAPPAGAGNRLRMAKRIE